MFTTIVLLRDNALLYLTWQYRGWEGGGGNFVYCFHITKIEGAFKISLLESITLPKYILPRIDRIKVLKGHLKCLL